MENVNRKLTLKCIFNGNLRIRKGDIIRITRVIVNTEPLVVTTIENVTDGLEQQSRDDAEGMSFSEELKTPVVGKILASTFIGGNDVTEFVIQEGEITPDYVFVKAGQTEEAQSTLVNILKN